MCISGFSDVDTLVLGALMSPVSALTNHLVHKGECLQHGEREEAPAALSRFVIRLVFPYHTPELHSTPAEMEGEV